MAALLIICLVGAIALCGCGKKGGEAAAPETGVKSVAPAPGGGGKAGGAAVGPGATKAAGGAPPAAPTPGPGGAPAAPAAPQPAAAPGGGDGALVKQATAAKHAGDYDKALQILAKAGAQNADAQWVKAWILAEQGKKDQAIAAFNAFIAAAKPSDARVVEAKGALTRLGAGAPPGPAAGPPGAGGPPGPPATK